MSVEIIMINNVNSTTTDADHNINKYPNKLINTSDFSAV